MQVLKASLAGDRKQGQWATVSAWSSESGGMIYRASELERGQQVVWRPDRTQAVPGPCPDGAQLYPLPQLLAAMHE